MGYREIAEVTKRTHRDGDVASRARTSCAQGAVAARVRGRAACRALNLCGCRPTSTAKSTRWPPPTLSGIWSTAPSAARRSKDLEQVRTALRRELTYERAPPQLRARIISALDRESAVGALRPTEPRARAWRARPFWMGAAGGFGGAAHRGEPRLFSPGTAGHQCRFGRPRERPCALADAGASHRCGIHRPAYRETLVCGSHRCLAGGRRLRRSRLSARGRTCRLLRSSTCRGGGLSARTSHHQCLQLGRRPRNLANQRDPQWLSFYLSGRPPI